MATLFEKFGFLTDKISSRSSDLPDFQGLGPGQEQFLYGNQDASHESRSKLYKAFSGEAFQALFANTQDIPDHMLHVTCTGYLAPSPAQVFCEEKSWDKTEITNIYHMGCSAAFPALRLAEATLLSERSSSISIVHTEYCSLHLNFNHPGPEQAVIQTLFGDGAIRYTCKTVANAQTELPADKAQKTKMASLEMILQNEHRIPNSLLDMTWEIGDSSFAMGLSRLVPKKIASNIQVVLNQLRFQAEQRGVPPKDFSQALFAIHPGGPKIIDTIAEQLQLTEMQVRASRDVLKNHGNMSSATLPHVWKNILEDPHTQDGRLIVSLAFGPGLTVFSGLFRVIKYD